MAMPVRARLDDILVKISWPSKSGTGVSETRRPKKNWIIITYTCLATLLFLIILEEQQVFMCSRRVCSKRKIRETARER